MDYKKSSDQLIQVDSRIIQERFLTFYQQWWLSVFHWDKIFSISYHQNIYHVWFNISNINFCLFLYINFIIVSDVNMNIFALLKKHCLNINYTVSSCACLFLLDMNNGLIWLLFDGISTIVGCLMLNLFFFLYTWFVSEQFVSNYVSLDSVDHQPLPSSCFKKNGVDVSLP